MSALGTRLRRAWAGFVGPEATPSNHVLTAASAAVGAVVAPVTAAREDGTTRADLALATLLAADLWGGAYVNNTRASARWYERPEQSDADHVRFAAAHVHPAAVAWLDRGTPRRVPPVVWAAGHYAYLLTATVVIRRNPAARRPLGVFLTAGGLALDRLLGPSATVPWFAWTYYPKLLLGHAAASLWSDAEL